MVASGDRYNWRRICQGARVIGPFVESVESRL